MMMIEKRNIEDLHEHPNNVRVHPPKQTAELVKSITQFGSIRPIIIDENNTILCGHGLYKAYIAMGLTEVDVMVKSGLTENQKKKLMLADNKVYTLGIDNYEAIDKMMNELMGDFDIPGYDSQVLDDLYGASSLQNEPIKESSFSEPIVQESPKKEQIIENVRQANQQQEEEQPIKENVIYAQTEEETDKPYIICPHCQRRIYLE